MRLSCCPDHHLLPRPSPAGWVFGCSEAAAAAASTSSPAERRGLLDANVGMASRTGGLLTSAPANGGPMYHVKEGELNNRMRSPVLNFPTPAVSIIPLGWY